MSPQLRRWAIAGPLAAFGTALAWAFWPDAGETPYWLRQASPGPLNAAHAFLERECASCHEPLQSVPPALCIACHADNKPLLQRQPTAFHASVGACADCHREHRGRQALRAPMDHEAIARLGAARLRPDWAPQRSPNPALRAMESTLDCANCHATKDRHRGLFGTDCGACHATAKWTIAEFRHPSPGSRDCAQCHEAPPSHYMEHFTMVSRRVAGQMHAEVRECFLCHRTTSWNDILGVGFYKHH